VRASKVLPDEVIADEAEVTAMRGTYGDDETGEGTGADEISW